MVRVVDGGGGLHGDGDGDGGGGLHGNCCQVRRPHVASSNLALVVCGCHRVYCSLGASGRCRGDMVRSTNTQKTPGGDVKGAAAGAGAHLLGICYCEISDPALLS